MENNAKLKNSEGEKKLLANVKREINQPRLTKSARMDVNAEAKLACVPLMAFDSLRRG